MIRSNPTSIVTALFLLLLLSVAESTFGQADFNPDLHDAVTLWNKTQTVVKVQAGWHGRTDWSDHFIQPGQGVTFHVIRGANYPTFLFAIHNARANDKANYRVSRQAGSRNPVQVEIRGTHGNFTPSGQNVLPGHWQKNGGWVRYFN